MCSNSVENRLETSCVDLADCAVCSTTHLEQNLSCHIFLLYFYLIFTQMTRTKNRNGCTTQVGQCKKIMHGTLNRRVKYLFLSEVLGL